MYPGALAFDDVVEVVLTETLLADARAVLVDPDFRGQLLEALADSLDERAYSKTDRR